MIWGAATAIVKNKLQVKKSLSKSMMSKKMFYFGGNGYDAEHVDVSWEAGDVDIMTARNQHRSLYSRQDHTALIKIGGTSFDGRIMTLKCEYEYALPTRWSEIVGNDRTSITRCYGRLT